MRQGVARIVPGVEEDARVPKTLFLCLQSPLCITMAGGWSSCPETGRGFVRFRTAVAPTDGLTVERLMRQY